MFFIDEVQEFLTTETEIMQEKPLKRFTQEIGQEKEAETGGRHRLRLVRLDGFLTEIRGLAGARSHGRA